MPDIEHGSAQLQMEHMFLRVQRKLFGDAFRRTIAHYAVIRPIGQGAMGMVYEAVDVRLGREVALKLVLPEVLPSSRGKSRLLREARAMAKISHPNVVAVYDVGEAVQAGGGAGDVVFIAMELVRGVTLRRWLASAPRSVAEILDVFAQAGAGLAAAHQAEIVHRDFKPDNVLVGEDGRARVLDFGLAFPQVAPPERSLDDDATPPNGIALPGFIGPPATRSDDGHVLAGTIAYMSPEQLRSQPLDGRSDQFSFGIALYEALYGQRPFSGRSFQDFVDHVTRGELAPVPLPPRLPGWLIAVLRRGLATMPGDRYPSMPALLGVLIAGRHGMTQRLMARPDLPYVPLAGLMRQPAGCDPALAVALAAAVTETVHARAQLGDALDRAALDSLLIGAERYELGPIDPGVLVEVRDEGRYRVIGELLALLSGAHERDDAAGFALRGEWPAGLRAVIERLLSPEGYRSARGVLHDLAHCRDELARGPAVAAFALAGHDVGDRLAASNVVRGRARELAQLEQLARQIGGGRSGLALISGPSGIGKSVLIDELGARQRRGWRIQGKFDQYANAEPYATLTQALRGLVRQIVDEPAAARDDWRERIVRAVAPNAELLFSVIPELRGLIGDQPAVAAIPPVEAAARFGETLKRLLVACAAQIGLLVVVLDDMQWCDQASIRLICQLLGDREVGHILWICAFRDPAHALHQMLADAPVADALRVVIQLGPLVRDELQAFLADSLGCAAERAAQLATFFHDKTDGNPLYAHTLLAALHDQGCFAWSPRLEHWTWDDAAIRSAELPGSIQELLQRKIEALSPVARELLAAASCVGRDVEADLLVEALARRGHDVAALAAAIRECAARGLLAIGAGDQLNFTHDRVQQTAYRFLEPARREQILLDVGRALLDRTPAAEIGDKLFRIVGYFSGGAAHADAALKERIVELDLMAAQRALAANAFADSVRLLDAALALLPDDHWVSRYEQTVALYLTYMHARALLGERERENELFELVRGRVTTPVHLGQVYELKVMLETSRGEHRAAIEHAIAGLRALGERLPAAPGKLATAAELARTWSALRKLDPEDLKVRPSSADNDAAASRLLVALSAPAYLADANLLSIVMMRIVRRSLQFGMTDVSSHGFAGFGLICAGLLGRYERGRRYAMLAHQLDERFGNRWLQPKVDLMSGIFVQPWTRPFERCEDVLARGRRIAGDNADFAYASYTATSAACLMYYRGAELARVIEAGEAALRDTRRAGDHDMESVVVTVLQVSRCLRGETASAIDVSTPEHGDASLIASLDVRTTPVGAFFCRAIRCGVLYLHGRADLACAIADEASAFEANAFSNPSFAEYVFFDAMAQLRRAGVRGKVGKRVHRALAKLATWARYCPANFEARHALLEAELARVTGRGAVLDKLNLALEAAVRHERVHYEALAAELAAAHCTAAGQATLAQIYFERALRAYQRWGATRKVRMLEQAA